MYGMNGPLYLLKLGAKVVGRFTPQSGERSVSERCPAGWVAGPGWLGSPLGSTSSSQAGDPRPSHLTQLGRPAWLASLAGQLGWPAFLGSLAGWFGARRTPSESAGSFLGGPWTGISFQTKGENEIPVQPPPKKNRRSRKEYVALQTTQPSCPEMLASQAGQPSWPVGSQAGQLSCPWT